MSSFYSYEPEPKLSTSRHSINYKVLECQMRKQNDQYQEMLIHEKQLELQFLEEQTRNKSLLKTLNKYKKSLGNLQTELSQIRADNAKQQAFLKEYYKFLDNKLKMGPKPIILFAGLEKIQEEYNMKLEQERINLEKGMEDLKKESSRLANELEKLDDKKNLFIEELEIIKMEKQAEKLQNERKNASAKKKYEEHLKQIEFYEIGIKQLRAEKLKCQSEQKTLKKVRDIEDYHKKYWLSIENAIKKEFSFRMRTKHYQQAVSEEYKVKLPEIQTTLNAKKYEKQMLEEEIVERQKKLLQIKNVLSNSMNRMSKVQSEMNSHQSSS